MYQPYFSFARNFVNSPIICYISILLLNMIKWVKSLLNWPGLLNIDISNKQESPLYNP